MEELEDRFRRGAIQPGHDHGPIKEERGEGVVVHRERARGALAVHLSTVTPPRARPRVDSGPYPPIGRIVKCVDRETGAIAGFANWAFNLTERTPEQYKKKKPSADWTEGRQKEIAEHFMALLAAEREKIWAGKPHIGEYWARSSWNVFLTAPIELCFLAVHRDHQRKGVGKVLVQWGLEQAKVHGLPVSLDSAPSGVALYRHLGFREIDKIVVKAEDYDAKEDYELLVMVKEP